MKPDNKVVDIDYEEQEHWSRKLIWNKQMFILKPVFGEVSPYKNALLSNITD